nr:MAG: hypothetical protein [Flaviviridae sp.]
MYVFTEAATVEEDLAKAWKPDFTKWSFDPSTWNDTLKARMWKVASAAGYSMNIGCSLPVTLAYAFLMFGLVKLSWSIVITASMALYGWKRGNRNFLFLGLGATYALAFGLVPSLL